MLLIDAPIDPSAMIGQPQLSPIASVADWFTVIAFPLTLLGLWLTYRQSKKTKSAADAAKKSAKETSDKIESFQYMATLSRNIEILKSCPKLLLESQWLDVAHHLTEARDQLLIIMTTEQSDKDHENHKKLKILKDNLNIDIRNLYTRANDESFELMTDSIFDRINEAHEIFVTKQAEIKKL